MYSVNLHANVEASGFVNCYELIVNPLVNFTMAIHVSYQQLKFFKEIIFVDFALLSKTDILTCRNEL